MLTYGLFWFGILLTGTVMMIGGNDHVVQIMATICAWTPTFAFLLLFKRNMPEEGCISAYIKKCFQEKHCGKMSILLILGQTVMFLVALFITATVSKGNLWTLLDLSASSILINLIHTLLGGASGEELGWRGFLHFELTGKYGIIKGPILVGLTWSLWHCPLWLLNSGYAGVDLIIYIIGFMVSNISAAVIIGICYDKKTNLLIPMLIHFMFNFLTGLYVGEIISLMSSLAITYFIAAVITVLVYTKKGNRQRITVRNV